MRGAQDGQRFRGRAGGPVRVVDAMPPPRGADVLAQQLPRGRMEEPDMQVVPLHGDTPADPPRRRAVVRGIDFDTAIEMHRAPAEAVIPKRLEGEGLQRGLLFRKHHGDLALGRPMDAGIGPPRLPAIEIGLRLLDRLEAHPP